MKVVRDAMFPKIRATVLLRTGPGYYGTSPDLVFLLGGDGRDPHRVLADVFAIGNKETRMADLNGKKYPADVRSVSVGDRVVLDMDEGIEVWECLPVGWAKEDHLPEHTTRHRDLVNAGAASVRLDEEDYEVTPRCDECGIAMEETSEWCGACGNCLTHCSDNVECSDRIDALA